MANDYISRQNVQLEIMSDGTLHITATVDVANTNRILLSQAGTHLGDLYYRDDERKKGKWVDSWRSKMDGTRYWYRECDHCGYERNDDDPEKDSNFCPNCGSDMRGEQDE